MVKQVANYSSVHRKGPPAFAFFLTYIGALIYFIDKANGLGEILLSFLQALVWPALLINKIFTVLHI